ETAGPVGAARSSAQRTGRGLSGQVVEQVGGAEQPADLLAAHHQHGGGAGGQRGQVGVHASVGGQLPVGLRDHVVDGLLGEHTAELRPQLGGGVVEEHGDLLIARPVFLGVVVARWWY